MKTVPIRNQELMAILDKFVPLFQQINFETATVDLDCSDIEQFLDDDYKNFILKEGRRHDGFPSKLVGLELSAKDAWSKEPYYYEMISASAKLKSELQGWTGTRQNALSAVYPAGGFISWHNNANAPGYNVLFTWSSEGDGQFEYIDPITKEHIVVPDVKGWQCKVGYYGTYEEHDRLMYHAARTNCLRATIAFMFNPDETGRQMSEMLIEDISES